MALYARLTVKEKRKIFDLWMTGMPASQVAKKTKRSYSAVLYTIDAMRYEIFHKDNYDPKERRGKK